MSGSAGEFLKIAVGMNEPGPREIGSGEMAVRAILGFVALLIMLRVGRRRLMGRIGPFDLVVTMILGSTLSRGITGNSRFFSCLAGCGAIIAAHWLISTLAAYFPVIGRIVEGGPVLLVQDGRMLIHSMHRHGVSVDDVTAALRLEGKETEVGRAKLAMLECSGHISVVTGENSEEVHEPAAAHSA